MNSQTIPLHWKHRTCACVYTEWMEILTKLAKRMRKNCLAIPADIINILFAYTLLICFSFIYVDCYQTYHRMKFSYRIHMSVTGLWLNIFELQNRWGKVWKHTNTIKYCTIKFTLKRRFYYESINDFGFRSRHHIIVEYLLESCSTAKWDERDDVTSQLAN